MLYAPIIATVFSALRIALFSAFDATRPPDMWRPGEQFVNSTPLWFEALSVIPPPSVTVVQVAIHASMAHSSLGHSFHLGSLVQAFHCPYEAPQFVSVLPSHCVALLKPTPLSAVVYVPPTPVIPATENFILPSVTWSTDIHWRIWTMVVNIWLRVKPSSELVWFVVLESLAIAIFYLIWFNAYRVASGLITLIVCLLRALKDVMVHVYAAQWSTALSQLAPVDVSNELKSGISIFSPGLDTLLRANAIPANKTSLLWTIAIGPVPLPYKLPEDVEDVEQYILCSGSTPLSNGPESLPYTVTEDAEYVEQFIICSELALLLLAFIIFGKALNVPLSTGIADAFDPANVPLPFDADVGIELNPADVPLPPGADIGIELNPAMVPLPFDAGVGITLDPTTVPLPFDADIGIELDPATVPLPFDADVGIELDPSTVPLPFDAGVGIELDPVTVPLPFDADVVIALDPTTVPLPFDADVGIELDPTTVPLPFDADVGIELEVASNTSPINTTAAPEEFQTSHNETIEPGMAEASSNTDTDGSLETTVLGLKPINAAEDDFKCYSIGLDHFKDDAIDDNQDTASDSGESTLVDSDSVYLNERLSVCSHQLHALDNFSDDICKPTSPATTTTTTPTELEPALASALVHEDSTKVADQEEAICAKSNTTQDIGKEASSSTATASSALVSDLSGSTASTSVPSSFESSSSPEVKGKGRAEPSVLEDASVQDTEAGQEDEEPVQKKKCIRGSRGKIRHPKRPKIILEVVGEGAGQSVPAENVEGLQASGSGLLPSQRDPPAATLATTESGATSVQRAPSSRGSPASSPDSSSSSASKGKDRADSSILEDASTGQDTEAGQEDEEPVQKKKCIRGSRGKIRHPKRPKIILEVVDGGASQSASGSGLLPSQRDPPAATLVNAESGATSVQRAPSGRGSPASSSDSSSSPASKGKGRAETQSSALEYASNVQDTEAGQEDEEPVQRKKCIRGSRGKIRHPKRPKIILEVVDGGASQSASGSGLLPSQRDPPVNILATADSRAASVQRAPPSRGSQVSSSNMRSPQRGPPAGTLETRGRPTPVQGEGLHRLANHRAINAWRNELEARSSNVPDAHRNSQSHGGPVSARPSLTQGPSSSGQREWHNGWRREERESVHEEGRVRGRAKAHGSMRSTWQS